MFSSLFCNYDIVYMSPTMLNSMLFSSRCCYVLCSCPVTMDLSPDFFFFLAFSFLFLSFLPSKRPPIGFRGGRHLCRIIMGSSWENCPWNGLLEKREKKKERKNWSCFRSFSETFIRALLLFGEELTPPQPSSICTPPRSVYGCQHFLR